MRPLIVGTDERAAVEKLRALAADNVMDAEAMKIASAKDIAAYRKMMAELSIELPHGFLVTYSHERQMVHGVVQHISVSVDAPNRAPHPAAVNMILGLFGMQPLDKSLNVWMEDVSRTEKAINVVQRL